MNAYDEGSGARRGPEGEGTGPGADPARDPASGPAHGLPPASDAGPRPDAEPAPEAGPRPDPEPAPEAGPRPDPEPAPEAGPRPDPDPGPDPVTAPPAEPRTGVAALSLPHQIGAALALAVVAVVVCVHLGMTFLHVAPANTVSKQHRATIENWIYPEFEQNWKLFAPNPLQQNVAVQVRAEIRTADGTSRTTGWYDLSARDGRAIDGNPLPSHTQQNELRRAWDFYVSTHDDDNRPVGLRGALSEAYLRRIMAMRLDRAGAAGADGAVERVQVRSRTTDIPPPDWSEEEAGGERIPARPVYRTLPWWTLPGDETRGGIG
ncbi:DUF5819 family protein [Streptomyces sp. enrichment culture]|uniref:DUF5819 family protein n=1 Tax=Streptomyces sp. enrichment culture TaxID=1795815 RepID=UPI003F578547